LFTLRQETIKTADAYMKLTVLFFILLLLIIAPSSFAGECTEGSEFYFKTLAAADIDKDQSNLILCLCNKVNYYILGYEYFASPTALDKINKENEPIRKMVWGTLPKFLKSKSEINRCAATQALAYYKWPGSYEYLTVCENIDPERKAISYAVLGDKRAIPWVIGQYKNIDSLYKKNPQQSYPQKMTYLNALYHLASPESLPFIEEIINNPASKEIKERATKVKKRILEIVK
jgi:hypothetical protein